MERFEGPTLQRVGQHHHRVEGILEIEHRPIAITAPHPEVAGPGLWAASGKISCSHMSTSPPACPREPRHRPRRHAMEILNHLCASKLPETIQIEVQGAGAAPEISRVGRSGTGGGAAVGRAESRGITATTRWPGGSGTLPRRGQHHAAVRADPVTHHGLPYRDNQG